MKNKLIPCKECLVYATCKQKKGTLICDTLYKWFQEELRLARNEVIDKVNKYLPNCFRVGEK